MGKIDFAVGIGGAAGQGIATPGDILARVLVRRGLHLNAYNAYQSIIRGGHIFLILRAGGVCLYDGEKVKPGTPNEGVQMCPLPVRELAGTSKIPSAQNTIALGALLQMLGIEFQLLEDILARQFAK